MLNVQRLAGLVTSIASKVALRKRKESFPWSAQTALATGVAVSVQYGADAVNDLEILLAEGIDAKPRHYW